MTRGLLDRDKEVTPRLASETRLRDTELESAFVKPGKSLLKQRLGYATFFSLKYMYLYVETPKTACTKTKSLLWNLDGLPPRDGGLGALHRRERYEGRPSLLDLGYNSARHLLESPSFFKFCFFRDPVNRMVSGYKDKIRRRALPEQAQLCADIVKRFDLLQREDIQFSHFAQYVCSQDNRKRDHHWQSQWALTMADYITYDFVGRVENYEEDLTHVLRKLGAPDELMASIGTKINASRGHPVQVDPELADLIRQTYAQDYKLLEFSR